MSDVDRQLLLTLQKERDAYRKALTWIASVAMAPSESNALTRAMREYAADVLREPEIPPK